jgi:hypothetical protein
MQLSMTTPSISTLLADKPTSAARLSRVISGNSLLLVVDVPYAATTQRGNVASKDNHVCALGIEAIKIAVQI